MIKNTSKQTGSIFIVIILILMVAIILGLTFIFWNNNKGTQSSTQSSQQKQKTSTSAKPQTTGALNEVYIQGRPDSASDVKRITVGGEPAFSYSSGYEGLRYTTVVNHKNRTYQITYRFKDGGDVTTYESAYDLVTSSLKFLD